MRRVIRTVLLGPELWYSLLAWTLLSLILTLPDGLRLWAPDLHAERTFTAYASVPALELLVTLFLPILIGFAVAWRNGHPARRIIGAMVTAILALWGTWLIYWAVTDLAPILWQWTAPPLTEPQEQSYYINWKLIDALLGSLVAVSLGAVLGAIGGVIGYGLHERHVSRSLSPSHP